MKDVTKYISECRHILDSLKARNRSGLSEEDRLEEIRHYEQELQSHINKLKWRHRAKRMKSVRQ